MNCEKIIVERKGPAGIITLNCPEKANALSTQLMEEAITALRELDKDDEVRVVIIKGAGKHFSAGFDFTGGTASCGTQMKNFLEMRAWVEPLYELQRAITSITKLVIAAVHGQAVGGGFGIVMVSDFAVISGKEAERIGMVNKAVPREKLEEAVMELAEELASKNPIALRLSKQTYYKILDMETEKALAYAANMVAIVGTTEDAQEGLAAFFEKRTPQWKGR